MQTQELDLVTVVIPVYNAEAHLAETIESILAQSYPEIEIVAIDDGSSDRSVEILQAYGDRITLVQQANGGPAAARNHGAREANGKWLAFLDADDTWHPDKIKKQIEACTRSLWCYTDAVFVGGVNDGKRDSEYTSKHSGMVLEKLVRGNFIGTSSVFIERQMFLEMEGFNEKLRSIEDWELWIRLASRYPIEYIDEPLVSYRVHTASASRSTRATLPNHIKVIEKAFAPDGPAQNLRHLMPMAKAESYSICSMIAEEEKDFAFALSCSLQACRFEPLRLSNWERAIKSLTKYIISLAFRRDRPIVKTD